MNTETKRIKGEILLEIKNLMIEGNSDGVWHPIVKGVDLTLRRGEVLGLIGESGAGKSTVGLAAMGFARPGCRIIGGSIVFDGIDLMKISAGCAVPALPMSRKVLLQPSIPPTNSSSKRWRQRFDMAS